MSSIQKSFLQLVSEVGQIRIPAIQRDYAQGRENEKVNEIRKQFVHVLMQVVKGLKSKQELDFVYGSHQIEERPNNKDAKAFEPLDGQQRLTTLFLIHWMMGCELLTSDRHSILTYSTRPSSKDFCNELVKHNAADYIGEAKEKSSSNKKATTKPSEIIKEKDWFSWSWKFDPTIQSMLVMIDAIYEEIVDGIDMEEGKRHLDNIVFDFRDLNELKASDELFVKMNARGKQLSDFDILKSILEEELQIQKQEKKDGTDMFYATQKDEEDWRSFMDGNWIDMFWNKYARSVINGASTKEEKKAITVEVERKFRRLLLRLIALQLFTQDNLPSNLESACYHVDDKDLNAIIYAYQDNMIALRQKKGEPFCCPRINFRQLIDDMNCIVYNNDDICEITELLDKGFLSYTDEEDDTNSSGSLLDAFIKDTRLGNDVEVIFYSVLLYLRKLPLSNYNKDSADVANFKEWAKVMRNVTLNVNLNQRIDKISIMKEHLNGVDQFLDKLITDKSKEIDSNRDAVREFVAGLGSVNRGYFTGIDNESLSEEIKKATLKLSVPQWVDAIETAENHPYLRGQIRCLLDWAGNDIEEFQKYSKRLRDILNVKGNDNNEIKYYAAMLSAVPDAWKQHRGLYLFNYDRDNSIKRCLRDKDNLGKQQKELIDIWCEKYPELSVLDFFEKIREETLPTAEGWRKCVIDKPEILFFSYNKMIFEDTNNHVVIAQRKTPDSHCIDPILYYIRIKFSIDNKEDFGDSKSAIQHFVKFENNGHYYMVKWDGRYLLIDNGEEKTFSEDELVEFVFSILQH